MKLIAYKRENSKKNAKEENGGGFDGHKRSCKSDIWELIWIEKLVMIASYILIPKAEFG